MIYTRYKFQCPEGLSSYSHEEIASDLSLLKSEAGFQCPEGLSSYSHKRGKESVMVYTKYSFNAPKGFHRIPTVAQ